MPEKKKSFIKTALRNYRLSVVDKQNLTEVFSMQVSEMKFWGYNTLIFVLGVIVTVLLIFYTPVKYNVPGYPSGNLSKMMVYHSIMIDSLSSEIEKRDTYLENIRQVITGGVVVDTIYNSEDTHTQNANLQPVRDDSIFNALIGPDKYKFSYMNSNETSTSIGGLNFFTPVEGVVINRFNAGPGHYGTDIVAKENSQIYAVLDGTVIFAEWLVTTGYVVQIQHSNNIISIYKHNSEITVKPGERVKAGDVIAIIGDEGMYSTGPHLHIELWQNGMPLDPEAYINF
ncbi:MAG: M23 family metallopeptidase [Prolixibacteraceae bacterium]|jgi:murein DD-endopeptidase MepM/ murein hydrolase activator NlpD|nr:M23 family metallopeptidase [Prolixibacteraceae bacterium]